MRRSTECIRLRRGASVLSAAMLAATLVLTPAATYAQADGLLVRGGEQLFPIGFYELPGGEAELTRMAEAGVNLVRCGSTADLDRAAAAGMMGWVPLPVHAGPTDDLRKRVDVLKDHPALAVWEGPDEIVWGFTGGAAAVRGDAYESGDEWWRQHPRAIEYAREKGRTIIPNIRDAIAMIRELDASGRPFWINEALYSDVHYVRQYMDVIDITGCDYYPSDGGDSPLGSMASAVERWHRIARGKPVWMVLQGFAHGDLGRAPDPVYPTFADSRFMAYDVIVRGARGVLYWGSHYLRSDAFRQSLYALTSELAALQPFLVAAPQTEPRVRLVEMLDPVPIRGVQVTVRRVGDDWLVILVNEDDVKHMGVEVTGLEALEGQSLDLLYGDEQAVVNDDGFVVRLQPFEVKVFASSRQWESQCLEGRGYVE
jgi:hypothetical protein